LFKSGRFAYLKPARALAYLAREAFTKKSYRMQPRLSSSTGKSSAIRIALWLGLIPVLESTGVYQVVARCAGLVDRAWAHRR